MKSNARIAGAVLVGVSTWLLACYAHNGLKNRQRRVTKKLAQQAVHAWEGEGGAIIDAPPRVAGA